MKTSHSVAFGCLFFAAAANSAAADVAVFVGYYNNIIGAVNPDHVPFPFNPDANTTLVSSGNLDTTHDTGVIRLQNLGAVPVTIDAGLKVNSPNGPYQIWDASLPFVLNPGQNLVLAETANYNFDSSDYVFNNGFADPVVMGSVNGVSFSFVDTGRVLYGREDNNGQGNSPETTPYARIGVASSVPEPTSWALVATGLLAFANVRRRPGV